VLLDAARLGGSGSWAARLRPFAVAVGLGVVAGIAVWVWRQGELGAVAAAVVERPWAVAAAFAAYFLAFALRAWAWVALVGGAPLRFTRALAILHAALAANHLLPLRAGEGVRVALARSEGVPVQAAVGSTVFARLLDVVILAGLSLPVWLIAARQVGVPVVALLPLLLLSGLAVAGALFARWRGHGERWLPAQPKAVLPAAAATAGAWALEAGMVLAVAGAVEAGFPLWQALAATAFTVSFQLFHLTPGGLGMYEASMTGALVAFDFEPSVALGVAVSTHALKYGYALVAGGAAGVQLGWGWLR